MFFILCRFMCVYVFFYIDHVFASMSLCFSVCMCLHTDLSSLYTEQPSIRQHFIVGGQT